MAISINPKPTIYHNLCKHMDDLAPEGHHLYHNRLMNSNVELSLNVHAEQIAISAAQYNYTYHIAVTLNLANTLYYKFLRDNFVL